MRPAPGRLLADFATGLARVDVPSVIAERSQLLLLDALACAIAGREASARADFARAARMLGDGLHLVIGDTQPTGLAAAAMLNAWQTTALTMCDVFRPRMCHVSPPLLGAGMGVAPAQARISDLSHAFLVGAEVTVRLCESMDEALFRGARWHAPGVIGPFGSATTAALLLGLDADGLERAWGLALLQAAGTFASIGSAGVKFTQARAALAGVTAVQMAQVGLGGQLNALDHPDGGLWVAYGGDDDGAAVRKLGDEWRLVGISLRRWPAASSLQSVVEAVLGLREGRGPSAQLRIELPPQSYTLCADKGWNDQLTALQSARWVAASAWQHGRCDLDQFTPSSLEDESTAALARTVAVHPSEDLPDGGARLIVDGQISEVISPLGGPERPLDRSAVESKLRGAAGDFRADAVLRAFADDDLVSLRRALIGS